MSGKAWMDMDGNGYDMDTIWMTWKNWIRKLRPDAAPHQPPAPLPEHGRDATIFNASTRVRRALNSRPLARANLNRNGAPGKTIWVASRPSFLRVRYAS